jgi:Endoglucanase
MKKHTRKYLCLLLILVLAFSIPAEITAAPAKSTKLKTPLAKNGRLKVKKTSLLNSKGKPVVLKGVSTHGINWFPEYVNPDSFKTLRDNWRVNCIRLAMYTEEYNGYCSGGSKKDLKSLIDKGVTYATELGMYVIIDWHT